MNINRLMTNKLLCLRSNFDGALLASGLPTKFKSEIYYGRTVYNSSKFGSGFHSLHIASVDIRTRVKNNIWFRFKLSK